MKLKLIKSIALLLLFALSFQSCKKEETKSTNTPGYPDLTGCKVTRFYEGDGDTRITYNANGTIAKIEEYQSGELMNTNTYTYETGMARYSNTSGREKGDYVLNSSGRVTSSIIVYYQAQDPTTATSGVMTTYKYNSDGNLIEKQDEYNSSAGKTNYLTTYTWNNGNLMKEVEIGNNNNINIIEYEYYTDKSNALAGTDAAMDFTGVQSKNLPKSQKDGESGLTIVNFTYEFNSSGKPTKLIYEEDGNKDEINLEMTCP
ncbi:MAG: hypothetical protein ACOVO9_08360 [Bacteroidia bacterium]